MKTRIISDDELESVYRSTIAIRESRIMTNNAPVKMEFSDSGLEQIEAVVKELMDRRERDVAPRRSMVNDAHPEVIVNDR